MTNFERIKDMSVAEMAELLLEEDREDGCYIIDGGITYSKEKAIEDAKQWLESEWKEE